MNGQVLLSQRGEARHAAPRIAPAVNTVMLFLPEIDPDRIRSTHRLCCLPDVQAFDETFTNAAAVQRDLLPALK